MISDDPDLQTVVAAAAVLISGLPDLSPGEAASRAVNLWDECRKALNRHETSVEFVPFEEAIKSITKRKEERSDRIETAFERFLSEHTPNIGDLRRSRRNMDQQGRFEFSSTEEDINDFLEVRRRQGFSPDEVQKLTEEYTRVKRAKKRKSP